MPSVTVVVSSPATKAMRKMQDHVLDLQPDMLVSELKQQLAPLLQLTPAELTVIGEGGGVG